MIQKLDRKRFLPKPATPLGKCPKCGGDVFSGYEAYYCINRSKNICDFRIRFKSLASMGINAISANEMQQLLDNKVIDFFGLIRKDKKSFDTSGVLAFSDDFGWCIKLVDRGFKMLPSEDRLSVKPE